MTTRYNNPKAVMRNSVLKAQDVYPQAESGNSAAIEVYAVLEDCFVRAAYQVNEKMPNLDGLKWLARKSFKAMAMGLNYTGTKRKL